MLELELDLESEMVSDGAHAVSDHARSKHLLRGILVRRPSQDLERSWKHNAETGRLSPTIEVLTFAHFIS